MPTLIRMAKTSSDLNDVLELRFRTAAQLGRITGPQSKLTGKLIDHLDVYPSTINLIATRDGKAAGSLRAVEYRPNERLSNLSFDFAESFRNIERPCAFFDMLVVTSDVAMQDHLCKNLIKTALGLLARRGLARAFMVVPSSQVPLMEAFGFQPLATQMYCNYLLTDVIAGVIDIEKFYEKFLADISDREIIRFQDVFYVSLFEPGEILAMEQERGSTAYILEEGEVEVLIRNKEGQLIPISVIKPGHLVGEIAMITNENRTASLIARTPVSCISFDRTEFMRLMYQEPHRSLDIFRIFSKRLNELNRRVAEMESHP